MTGQDNAGKDEGLGRSVTDASVGVSALRGGGGGGCVGVSALRGCVGVSARRNGSLTTVLNHQQQPVINQSPTTRHKPSSTTNHKPTLHNLQSWPEEETIGRRSPVSG